MKKDLITINNELRSNAISHGLCDQWQGEWKEAWSEETLAERYFKGIDFCFKHNYPSNEYFNSTFDAEFLRSVGIIANDRYSLLNRKKCAIMGNSEATIRCNGYNVCQVWIKDNATAHIETKNQANVRVHLFDNAKVDIVADNLTNVIVFKHSENCRVEYENIYDADIKVIDEIDYLRKQ